MKKFTYFSILIFLLSVSLSGQTYVSGIISHNEVWSANQSPYIVTANILLSPNVTLTIQPGVTIKFDSGTSLLISGELIARGTKDTPIVFTSNSEQTAGSWGYLYFADQSKDALFENDITGMYQFGSIMEYCIVEYSGQSSIANNGAIRLDNAHPFINYCRIINNNATGINAYNLSGSLKITNSLISGNTSSETGDNINAGGIFLSGNAEVLIDSDTITFNNSASTYFTENAGAIFVNNSGNTQIKNNIISANTSAHTVMNNAALVKTSAGVGLIINNLISLNTSNKGTGGVYATNATVENNIIYNNTTTASCGGIKVSGCNVFHNLVLKNRAIENSGGIHVIYGSNILSNVIADNTSTNGIGGGIFWWGCCSEGIFKNHIISNTATNASAIGFDSGMEEFSHNTICQNTNTANLNELNSTLFVKSGFNITGNNIFNNSAFYELFNSDDQNSQNINCTINWWGTSSSENIQQKIYDWMDNSEVGLVNFLPYLEQPDTMAPVSPVVNVKKIELEPGNVRVSWDRNPESDIAGYHIYYGNINGYSYSDMTDVGNDTVFILTNFSINDAIAVTAYDENYNMQYETVETIIPDNIVFGYESWYATAENLCSGLTLMLIPEPASCGICDDGMIEALVSGGEQPYTYSWNFDPELNSSTVYDLLPGSYSITVTDANGCTINTSTFITFTTSAENQQITYCNIFPNPVHNYFSLNIENEEPICIKIKDISGRIVKSFPCIKNGTYDVSTLKNGIYIYEIETSKDTIYSKLLIQN